MDEDLLRTGDFSRSIHNLDEYVELDKLQAREHLASKELRLDVRTMMTTGMTRFDGG